MSVAATACLLSAERLAHLDPENIVRMAIEQHSPDIAIAFSGAEDVVLIDMAARVNLPCRVFTLDTGRLHAETYRYLEQVREHYKINLEVLFPQPEAVEQFVREKGLFSFYRDGHHECCDIRKVEPLRRVLSTVAAWITGQRRDQSPQTRASVAVVELDSASAAVGEPLVKFNPLANWTSRQVWAYIREHHVPYNPLHERGFLSIGCEPCTRPTHPGEHEREGRWWWEAEARKECGLHGPNGSRPAITRSTEGNHRITTGLHRSS
ncbi:MAG TPA: phosphoadenylyl-sulfate reductase [Terriglobia bacterium]|nr:phosphoadenylyl-sulfate reductase [Terriglobia bacterium]